jgi:branched-chain amino acid transport system ATP-binding protein
MLEVEAVTTYYGPVRALEDVSLGVPKGSITAVLGANGAGKSSLLRTVSGVVRARHGKVRFGERDITGLAPEEIVRLGLAHVPEGGGVIAELTVEENLRLGALWRSDRHDRSAALAEVYELFPRLEELRRLEASSLSGGERQMLSIGRALMGRPTMLLLDEPSLGLAPLVTRQLFDTLRLLHDAGVSILLVEQNARMALQLADRAYVIERGRVTVEGPAADMLEDERVQAAYLGLGAGR